MKRLLAVMLAFAVLGFAVSDFREGGRTPGPCGGARVKFADTPEKCPCCGHAPVAVIFYGLPHTFGQQQRDAIEAGEVVMGGCNVSSDDPLWKCTRCGAVFYPTAALRRNW